MTIGEREYEFIRRLVYEHSRIHLGDDKRELVSARVAKRLRVLQIPDYKAYCTFLRSPAGPEELSDLVNVITTNFTSFFREAEHFDFLKNKALPDFCSRNLRRGDTLRVWSAACSTGEEPYSIAICLAEYFKGKRGWNWTVEATDISTRVLRKAEQGVYSSSRVRLPTKDWLPLYFQRGIGNWEGSFRVKSELRQQICFRHLNLLQADYPFEESFHVIFCCNVMIYFDRTTKELLLDKLTRQLLPGGYLLVGHSESLAVAKHSLQSISPSIYQKTEDRLQPKTNPDPRRGT